MYFEFANVLVFTVFAALFVVGNLVIARLLRPKSTHEPGKVAIYECGEPTIGPAWIRFDIRFYTVALMFVIFDVEIALLFPWGAVFRELTEEGLGVIALVEAGTFIAILMVGLAYVWARGDIEWTSSGTATPSREPDERTEVTLDAPAVRQKAETAVSGGDDA
ncbi:MAG: NADH-quinone oxidoreductase subunit A [Planctomycetota bacterium]|nr:NADH-quinone oxidoreductase subunit A [Planctomycetota bacterium]